MLEFIIPDWPAPPWVKAVTTTRGGGCSKPPFDSLNLSLMVGDNPDYVLQNRRQLQHSLGLSQNTLWLKQVHGNKVISADRVLLNPVADAVYVKGSLATCAVQTADCLPLLVCSHTHRRIAALHAGWKGLASGIIENSIRALDCLPDDLLVWLGPAIGQEAFVVGEEVVKLFMEKDRETKSAFRQTGERHWQANLYELAKQRLKAIGIEAIYGGNHCTYTDKENFFSFRREKITGRTASLIWMSALN